MSKRAPGLISLLTKAAWSVRLRLVSAAVFLVVIGFVVGWLYRWLTEPIASPSTTPPAVAAEPVASPLSTRAISKAAPSQTLYVLNSKGITEYPTGSSGNIDPITVISGELTGLSNARGIALDTSGNVDVATDVTQNPKSEPAIS